MKYLLISPALLILCMIPTWIDSLWDAIGLYVITMLIVPGIVLVLQVAGLISSIIKHNKTLSIMFAVELLVYICLVAMFVYKFIIY